MVEATAIAKKQYSLQQMTRTDFLVAASCGGNLRNGTRVLAPPLLDEALRKGRIRGEELPDELAKELKKPGAAFLAPQIIGFRMDGLPFGEFVRRLDEKEETRMLIPAQFQNEAYIEIKGKKYMPAVLAPEWDTEIKNGQGEGGRTLVTLSPIGSRLAPFGRDNFKFIHQGDLLMPIEAGSNGSSPELLIMRIFFDGEYAGPFIRTRNLIGDTNWLIFGKPLDSTATVIAESQNGWKKPGVIL
jgi:hypothetical protein